MALGTRQKHKIKMIKSKEQIERENKLHQGECSCGKTGDNCDNGWDYEKGIIHYSEK